MSDVKVTEQPSWDRVERLTLLIGVIGAGLCLAAGVIGKFTNPTSDTNSFFGWLVNPRQFYRSWLLGVQCWLGIGLGSMVILMIHHLGGGNWGRVIRRILEAAMSNIHWMILFFLPLLHGIHELYPWANWTGEQIHESHLLHQKSLWLNVPFWLIRTGIYFGVFLLIALLLRRRSRHQEANDTPEVQGGLRTISAPGILVYGALITFASVDWIMSLEPMWFSTVFGLLYGIAQVLAAHAFCLMILCWLVQYAPLKDIVQPSFLRDLGNLLLAFTMLWAYLAFSQFMLIWAGNVQEETPYYLKRLHGGWEFVGMFLVLCHFVLPFFMMLSRKVKQNPRRLATVAAVVLVGCWIDMYWWLVPAYRDPSPHMSGTTHSTIHLHWMDVAAIVGIGGLWTFMFLKSLRSKPLEPIEMPKEEGHHE